MYGPELIQTLRDLQAIWDPAWKMNPGRPRWFRGGAGALVGQTTGPANDGSHLADSIPDFHVLAERPSNGCLLTDKLTHLPCPSKNGGTGRLELA